MRVLIVGAGIAGPTVAYWLLRAGHEVTMVERAEELRSGGYVVDFWGAGFDVAERMGIAPELRRRGQVMSEVRAVDRNGRRIASLNTEAIMGAQERYVSIARSDLAAAIYEALDGRAELILDDTVDALVDQGDCVEVTFESGQTRRFDLVVGADGLHSRVRRLVFGPEEQFERYLGIVIAAFEIDGYRPRDELVAMMHGEVGFQAIRLSRSDDGTLLMLTVRHDGAMPAADRAAQEAFLRTQLAGAGWEVPHILAAMPQAKTFYFDSASQIRMPSWSRGRVVLLGDAAAAPSFLAGQGSALAMVGAYVLAAEVASCRNHRDAFERYEQRLRPLLESKQDVAKGLGLVFAPKNRFELLQRNMAMKMMGLPKVPGLLLGKSFHDAVELPDFPRSEVPG